MNNQKIAHYRKADRETQSVEEHLLNVSQICEIFAAKIDFSDAGALLGILHDIGKYSDEFQTYIKSSTGLLRPDIDDDYVDPQDLIGKVDHSTAGAQWVWQNFRQYSGVGEIAGQILAVCLASHHGGLIDCLRVDGKNGFRLRMNKDDAKTHLKECIENRNGNEDVLRILDTIATESLLQDFKKRLVKLIMSNNKESDIIKHFRLGFFTRFLFSCLIDADRIDTSNFENPGSEKFRAVVPVDWQIAIDRIEAKVASFALRNQIDTLRGDISRQCKERAEDEQGIYTLTVPTGGGKTFASMRFALHHAKKYGLDRIIYVIPFTSIIEQNAKVIREVLEPEDEETRWILEHHSNLEPETQTESSRIVTENWNAPIVFTTMVQFLETLFGGGTRGARRLHNTANAVIIFDEIQSLPVNIVHPFCNALQFLVDHAKSTAILCTATQPLLNDLQNPELGQLTIPIGNELVEDVADLFNNLKRVEIKNLVKSQGWSEEEIAKLAIKQVVEKGNCLVIVNTKKWARNLYEKCLEKVDEESIFHLSTNLCPAHRERLFKSVRDRLDEDLPVLCISTQLIEAGVDVDFNSTIRFLAGLDSIAQAAGRCNRNGNLTTAPVYVVNPVDEPIEMLPDIKAGREATLRIFDETEDLDILAPETMCMYFNYYFYDRKDIMAYPLSEKQAGRQDTLLNLLSNNSRNIGRSQDAKLQQSFKTAGKAFKAIDAPTQSVIVPYGKEANEIIAELCAAFEPDKAYDLLKRAQRYSVNVFPNVWLKLVEAGAVATVQEGEETYYLLEQFYSKEFGLSTEPVSPMGFLNG